MRIALFAHEVCCKQMILWDHTRAWLQHGPQQTQHLHSILCTRKWRGTVARQTRHHCMLGLHYDVLAAHPVQNIFADAGVEWKWYRYYNPQTVGLDFEGLCEDLRAAPEGSVIVLHGE